MNRHQRRAAAARSGGSTGAASALQYGLANHQAGFTAEAERYYLQALAHQPKHPDALHLLGCVMLQTGRAARGVDLLQRAVATQPDNAEYLSNLAAGYSRVDKLEAAAEAYGRSVDLSANSAIVFNDYGKVLEKLGKIAPALAAYAHGVTVDSMYAPVHLNLGRMLQKLERHEDALTSFDAACALDPDNAEMLCHRSTLLFAMRRFDEALSCIDRAVELAPSTHEPHNVRGSTLFRLGDLAQALQNFDRALEIAPDEAEIVLNRSSVLVDLHRMDEAFAHMERAIALRPDYAEAHNNIGLLSLLTGDLSRGWAETEWRWKCPGLKLKEADFKQPSWLGNEPVAGKTILLHSDQGLGDAVNFARYAPLVAAMGARVILAVDPPLVDVLSGVEGVALCVTKERAGSLDFDVHCPLTSLPFAFDTQLDTIPANVPYIEVGSSEKWRERLGQKTRPRIGLVWSGNPDHGNDHNRSLKFSEIAPLIDLPFAFYSLQKGVRDGDRDQLDATSKITQLGDELADFADTAALLSELDLLITADTSIAHLAGAMALPTWILLPHTPDWRWLLERTDSPWYPTARLFRQPQPRRWDEVIASVSSELRSKFGQSEDSQKTASLVARRCNYSLSGVT